MESIDLNPSFLRRVLFIWIAPIIFYYKRNKPSSSNLLQVSHQEEYENCTKLLKSNFQEQCGNAAPSFTKAFIKTFSREIFWLWLVTLIPQLLMVFECVLIYYIVLYIDDSEKSTTEGVLLALAFITQATLCAVMTSNSTLNNALFAVKIRRIFSNLIGEKCLKMHGSQINSKDTIGKCLNLITSDMVILDGLNLIILSLSIFVTFVAFFIVTTFYFGGWGVIGIGISFIHIPVILAIGSRNGVHNSTLSKISDNRVTLIQNLIEGINIIKLNAWEIPYLKRIYSEKEKEALLKKKISIVNNVFGVFGYAGIGLMLLISLTLFVKAGNEMHPSEIFFLLAIFFYSQSSSVTVIVIGVVSIFEILGAFKRLEQVLLVQELQKEKPKPEENPSLFLSGAEFSWNEEKPPAERINSQDSHVSEINFQIENNGLIIVAGESGSGKTTLLVGLLQEIFLRSGEYRVNGNISYAAEQPWLIPDTVKKNIILGMELHEEKYRKVLKSCDLLKDLEMLPKGDESVIGDRGVTLSGGQKSRIGLARALYSDSDIFLFDDPLSAVDTEVGNHLFKAIKELSEKKIVILATHQLHFLPQADKIIVLDNQSQIFCGTSDELEMDISVKAKLGSINLRKIQENEIFKEELTKKSEANLVVDNEEYEITVNLQTYFKYLLLGFKSKFKIYSIIFLMLPSQFAILFMQYWCLLWLENEEPDSNYYIIGLAIIVLTLYLTCALRSYPFYNFSIDSNNILHNSALEGLTKTNSGYFDTNTTGVIINRFSKDTATIDGLLTMYFYEAISFTINSLATTLAISIILPYVLIAIPIYLLLFYWFFSYFHALVVQLKSIEISLRGPLLSTYHTFFAGYSTIRALNIIPYFRKELEERTLNSYRADYACQAVFFFAQFYFQLSLLVILITNIVAIIATKGMLDPSLVGLSLTLSSLHFKISRAHNRYLIDLHSMMCSTQRLLNFSELEPEGIYSKAPDFVIKEGRIRFLNVCMRYRPGCKLALDNLNLTIEGGRSSGLWGGLVLGNLRSCRYCLDW